MNKCCFFPWSNRRFRWIIWSITDFYVTFIISIWILNSPSKLVLLPWVTLTFTCKKSIFVYCADENGDHKLAYTVFWLFYYTNHQNRIFVQKILIYFGKVWRKSNMCIIRYGWLIPLYLFIPLVCSTIFLIIKNSCFREELSDIPFFFRHNCNKSLWKNICANFPALYLVIHF